MAGTENESKEPEESSSKSSADQSATPSNRFWQPEPSIYKMEFYRELTRTMEAAEALLDLDVTGSIYLQLALISLARLMTLQNDEVSHECRDEVISWLDTLKDSLQKSIRPDESSQHPAAEIAPRLWPRLFLDLEDE